ncbi:MAG TPA: glycosyltransferase [Candidatus Kapabacteria bacterium]|nr:glycosyltransferase [Candidatus Kapabacteria bacterium]
MLHPTISIIVPALNEEKLIETTLRAFPPEILARCNAEVIVSDGGSHDRTVEIAERFADVVVVHTEQRRQTIAEGRNRGAEYATGDLLVFINADTVPRDVKAFARTLLEIATQGAMDMRTVAYACPVEVTPQERRLSDRIFHGFFNNYVRFLNLLRVGMGRGECQVIWRDAFVAVGGYNNAMVAGEDFELYSRLARRGRIGHSEAFYVYESPRRFRRYGYVRVLFSWTINALAVIFLRRSMSHQWEEVR